MLEDFIFDASEGQGARGVKTERFQVAGDKFHRCNPALANVGDKCLAVGKGRLRSPEAKPRRIGKIVDVRGAGCRSVDDPGTRQQVLQPYTGNPLFRSLDLAARSLASGSARHGMGFIEDEYAIEFLSCPGKDLLEAGGVGASRAQHRVGHEQDAFRHRHRPAQFPVAQGLDIEREAAQGRPVAARVLEQSFVLRYPDMTPLAPHPAIEDDARDLAALARSGAVAEEISHAIGLSLARGLEAAALVLWLEGPGNVARMRTCRIDQRLDLCRRQDAACDQMFGELRRLARFWRSDRAHCDRLDQLGRVLLCIGDRDAAGPIGQIVADLVSDGRGFVEHFELNGRSVAGRSDADRRSKRGPRCRGGKPERTAPRYREQGTDHCNRLARR